jgi:thiamine transport system permease protein
LDLWGLLPALAFLLLFTIVPVAMLLLEGGGAALGLGGILGLLAGVGTVGGVVHRALANSLLQAGLSAAVTFAWGYPVGVFLGRRRFPGRDTLLAFLLVPFLLPVLVVVFALQATFGPQGSLTTLLPSTLWLGTGLPAIVVVNVFYNVSLVALFTCAGVAMAPRRLEEAVATLGGGPWRCFRDVWGRPSLQGAAAGALLTFLFSFLSFAPPIILGGYPNYTVEAWIYTLWVDTSTVGNPGLAGPVAFLTVLLLIVPSALYLLVARRLRLLGGVTDRAVSPATRLRLQDLPFLGATVAMLAFVGLMLGSLFVGAFATGGGAWGWGNWAALFSTRVTGDLSGATTPEALLNTLYFAVLSTLMVLLVALAAGFARLRHPTTGSAVDLLSFLPLLISPVILALALWELYYGSLYTNVDWLLIVAAQVSLALPFAMQSISSALLSLSAGAREAAATLGAGRLRAFLDADVPRIRPALVTGALFAFALSLGEVAATNFLHLAPYTTIAVEMYVLEQDRLPHALGVELALGAMLAALSLVSFIIILGVSRRAGR